MGLVEASQQRGGVNGAQAYGCGMRSPSGRMDGENPMHIDVQALLASLLGPTLLIVVLRRIPMTTYP
jgi:hypothetical protein